tara:strand:+ start:202 stop:678 length:477 start_codon:yes stop_codon:yes gene_type:complete
MDPRTIGNYGGPKLDSLPVSNPETQVAAAEMNRYMEDLAQTTRTVLRAAVKFPTGVVSPVPAVSVFHRSIWGSGSAQKPVVTRTGVGLYTVTYAATFTDALGTIETVAFFGGHASVESAVAADDFQARLISVAANVVSVVVQDAGAPADVGTVTVWLL